jgi:hypothetical protein
MNEFHSENHEGRAKIWGSFGVGCVSSPSGVPLMLLSASSHDWYPENEAENHPECSRWEIGKTDEIFVKKVV